MWNKFVIFCLKVLSYVAARWIYKPFSKLWRFLFERKYTKLPQDTPWTEEQLLEFYRTCKWTQDLWNGKLDAISKPEKFYETREGDCDEFAAFGCAVLPWPSFILSVIWHRCGKTSGHNVCMYYKDKRLWHIGNWGKAGPYSSFMDLVYGVAPPSALPLTYSVRDGKSLKWMAGGFLQCQKKE